MFNFRHGYLLHQKINENEEEDQDDDNEESEKDEEEFHAEEEAGNATMPTQRSEGEKHKSRSVPMI